MLIYVILFRPVPVENMRMNNRRLNLRGVLKLEKIREVREIDV